MTAPERSYNGAFFCLGMSLISIIGGVGISKSFGLTWALLFMALCALTCYFAVATVLYVLRAYGAYAHSLIRYIAERDADALVNTLPTPTIKQNEVGH